MRQRFLLEQGLDVVLGQCLVDHRVFQRFWRFGIGVNFDNSVRHYLRNRWATAVLLDSAHLGSLGFHTNAVIEAHNVLGVDEVRFWVTIDASLTLRF